MKKLLIAFVAVVAAVVILAALFPERATNLAFRAERLVSGLEYKTVAVGDETWHYLEGGPQDAEVILLLHGFSGEKDNWTRFLRYFTDDFRVIVPDLPGFGETTRHADWDYALLPQRERVRGFVDKLGLQRFHLAGHSMGGHLSILYTHEYPQQVASLALLNNAGFNSPTKSDFFHGLERGENALIIRSREDFETMMTYAFEEQPFLPWPMRKVIADRAISNADLNTSIFQSLVQDFETDLQPILAEITSPLLVLWGDKDRILHVSSVPVMQQARPDAEVVIMKDMGHVPILERPAETAAHYLAFLQPASP